MLGVGNRFSEGIGGEVRRLVFFFGCNWVGEWGVSGSNGLMRSSFYLLLDFLDQFFCSSCFPVRAFITMGLLHSMIPFSCCRCDLVRSRTKALVCLLQGIYV